MKYLKDVYYRISADIMIRAETDHRVNADKVWKEFTNRIAKGKCFYQPYLGNRECMCFFAPVDESKSPIQDSRDMGIMLYDIFDPRSIEPLDTEKRKRLWEELQRRKEKQLILIVSHAEAEEDDEDKIAFDQEIELKPRKVSVG